MFFVVDAIQGLGPLRVNLRDTPVDVFTSGAQKWLVGPWGADHALLGLAAALSPPV